MATTRPPMDITPATFFEEWLPAQIATTPATRETRVRVELSGDGGGAWELTMGPAGLTVGAPAAAEPDVTIRQTVQDWRAIVVGEEGAVNLAPPQASPTDILLLDRQAQQVLQTVRGTIRFEVTGYNGRTWRTDVKLGPQPFKTEPDATISIDAETYAALLSRQLAAPQAFFSGRIKLSGDANLAMQIGMAMMPRMGS